MNSEEQNWLHAIIIWALIAAVTCLIVITQCNCATPPSLKKSHAMAGQALDCGMERAGGNESILKPLQDAKTMYGPSDIFIGPPESPVSYDPDTTQVDLIAMEANIAVKMQKLFKDMATDFAEKILPKQLSAFLPGKGEGRPPFDANGMILKIVGIIAGLYASWKGTGAVVKKIKNGKSKSGNEANPVL